ncbi:hypothetical protein IMZ48_35130, partial [Candidatus Bathyarchaeota archaeon]|nr:hypothetical protein [Candidatus Bathyarchaeota archaeon]
MSLLSSLIAMVSPYRGTYPSQPHPLPVRKATQSSFLQSAAAGQLPKETLGNWLANDRLYTQSYIKGAGRILSYLELPHETWRPCEH